MTADGQRILANAVNYTIIPEPGSMLLVGFGIAALLVHRRIRLGSRA
ncbi:MAG: PEP-CTERM sorting domain-containing protein [Verrucomicrobiales bacterium]